MYSNNVISCLLFFCRYVLRRISTKSSNRAARSDNERLFTVTTKGVYRDESAFINIFIYIPYHIRSKLKTMRKFSGSVRLWATIYGHVAETDWHLLILHTTLNQYFLVASTVRGLLVPCCVQFLRSSSQKYHFVLLMTVL